MDPLLLKIMSKLGIDEKDVSDLYMSGHRIPEVDTIVAHVHRGASYDEKFPFYALFTFMDLMQCEMFMRALIINMFRHLQQRVTYTQPLYDKKGFYRALADTCHDEKTCGIFVKTVASFV